MASSKAIRSGPSDDSSASEASDAEDQVREGTLLVICLYLNVRGFVVLMGLLSPCTTARNAQMGHGDLHGHLPCCHCVAWFTLPVSVWRSRSLKYCMRTT